MTNATNKFQFTTKTRLGSGSNNLENSTKIIIVIGYKVIIVIGITTTSGACRHDEILLINVYKI